MKVHRHRKRLGLRPVTVIVSEQEIDFLLARDYELTRRDDCRKRDIPIGPVRSLPPPAASCSAATPIAALSLSTAATETAQQSARRLSHDLCGRRQAVCGYTGRTKPDRQSGRAPADAGNSGA
jgi:hypothetical protein